jgi:hypothetical protein
VRTIERITLIYNANSGFWSAVVDSARKALDLNACSLCTITHGLTGERGEWRACSAGLDVPIDYLHRDELSSELLELTGGRLPCVLGESGAARHVLVGPDDLAACTGSASALERIIRERAAEAGLAFPE